MGSILSSKTVKAVALVVLLAVGAFWLMPERFSSSEVSDTEAVSEGGSSVIDEADSPFAVRQESESAVIGTNDQSDEDVNNAVASGGANNLVPIDVTALGHTSLSDAELLVLVERLRSDPQLLQQLIDEFRQTTDPDRLQRLSDILAHVGGEGAILLASELIFSGDDQSRKLGLSMLRKLQPGSEQARDIVSGLLSSEVEPAILTSTLSALALPGEVDDASRDYLVSQVSLLTTHEDPSVRGVSLDILSRWNSGDVYVPVLLGGLSDSSRAVRTAAGYALARYSGSDPDVARQLLQVAGDNREHKRARRAAILALKTRSLSQEQLDEVSAIERKLNQK